MSAEVEEYVDHFNRVNAARNETYCVHVIFSNGGLHTEYFNSKKEAAAFFAGVKYGKAYAPAISYVIPGVQQIDDLGGRE